MGSIGAIVYKTSIDLPANTPALAHESFASALEVSSELSKDMAIMIFDAAASSFVSGLRIVAITGAVLMLLCATTLFFVLRKKG